MRRLLLFLPLLVLGPFFVWPWQPAPAPYVPVMIWYLVAYWKASQVQSRSPVTGKRAMIGDQAEVTSTDGGRAKAGYQGAGLSRSPRVIDEQPGAVSEGVADLGSTPAR